MKANWTLQGLATELGLEYRGDPALPLVRLATLAAADERSVSFLANPQYRSQLHDTRAAAVIVHPRHADEAPCAVILSNEPYRTYARISHWFNGAPVPDAGVHPSAVVASDVSLGAAVSIGPRAVVEAGCVLGDGVVIGPGTVIGQGCRIGAGTRLHANVTLYHAVALGERCNVHSGVVIGADGFGFAPGADGWQKIAQIGGVRIGDDVEIGANTSIDRGALGDTIIGNGVILDNLIQIAHNVEIGDFTAIAGCTGIAGSTRIGRHCTIAGGVGIAGHLEIGDRVHITMRTDVTGSLTGPGSYSSGTAVSETREWRKNAARFRQLDALARRLIEIEKRTAGPGHAEEPE
jgi:UDP-3-O-[3-hydroxymyristoyl] glucosamine N-acyltransferase